LFRVAGIISAEAIAMKFVEIEAADEHPKDFSHAMSQAGSEC
jgi:hypothetical protein